MERKVKKYLEYIKNKDRDFHGNSKSCYVISEDLVLLTQKCHDEKLASNVISDYEYQNKVKKLGINMCETYDIEYIDGVLYILQERAKGNSIRNYTMDVKSESDKKSVVHQKDLEMIIKMSEAPQEMYDKYVFDGILLDKNHIGIDAGKPNLFFSEIEGFTFIDLQPSSEIEFRPEDLGDRRLLSTILFSGVYNQISSEDEYIINCKNDIAKKLVVALAKNGFSYDDIINTIYGYKLTKEEIAECIKDISVTSFEKQVLQYIEKDELFNEKVNFVYDLFDKAFTLFYKKLDYNKNKEILLNKEFTVLDNYWPRIGRRHTIQNFANLLYASKELNENDRKCFANSSFFKQVVYYIWKYNELLFDEELQGEIEKQYDRDKLYAFFTSNIDILEGEIKATEDSYLVSKLYELVEQYNQDVIGLIMDNFEFICSCVLIAQKFPGISFTKSVLDKMFDQLSKEDIEIIISDKLKRS